MSKQLHDSTVESRLEQLTAMIVELDEKQSMAELAALLDKGVAPAILLDCCMEAMREIGERFEEGVYFIAALIMAGEIMRMATEQLRPHLLQSQVTEENRGIMLIGTVQGDIHDLGKNLYTLLLRCNGVEVVDLGVDVPAEVFLEHALRLQPDFVGLSCVLTTSVENMKSTAHLLRQQLGQSCPPIIVGGTCVDERIADYVGPCIRAQDASAGLNICLDILGSKAQL